MRDVISHRRAQNGTYVLVVFDKQIAGYDALRPKARRVVLCVAGGTRWGIVAGTVVGGLVGVAIHFSGNAI